MNEVDIEAWVEAAPADQRGFREAVHIILDSIGHSQNLQTKMVMKGGLLLAIRYDSSRFTRDLDFSTSERYTAENADALLAEFEAGLVAAEDRLPYGTACRLQSRKVEPKGENRTHHNLALTIGFADKSNGGAMARLQAKNSPRVVQIDYSRARSSTGALRLGTSTASACEISTHKLAIVDAIRRFRFEDSMDDSVSAGRPGGLPWTFCPPGSWG